MQDIYIPENNALSAGEGISRISSNPKAHCLVEKNTHWTLLPDCQIQSKS